MRKLLLLALLPFALSCHSNRGKVNDVVITYKDFKGTYDLVGEVIDFAPGFDPMTYYVMDDTMLCATNWGATEEHPYNIEIYGMNSHKLLSTFQTRGKGPCEFLGGMLTYQGTPDRTLCIHDMVKNTVAFPHIDSVAQRGHVYCPKQVAAPFYASIAITPLGADTLLAFNRYYVTKPKFSNPANPLVAFRRDGTSNFDEPIKGCRLFTLNVSGGEVVVSPRGDRVVVFLKNENRIFIYNRQLQLLRVIAGEERFHQEYEMDAHSENHVSAKGGIYYTSYMRPFGTENHLYVIFINGNRDALQPVELLKFDWDLKPIARYKLDRHVIAATIGNSGEYAYCSESVALGKSYPRLVRYQLPQ